MHTYTLTNSQEHSKDTPAEVKGGLFSGSSKDLNQKPSRPDLCPSNLLLPLGFLP